jgi:hypothetical protein
MVSRRQCGLRGILRTKVVQIPAERNSFNSRQDTALASCNGLLGGSVGDALVVGGLLPDLAAKR